MDEEIIRERVNDFAKAFRERNLSVMMSLYAPDVVSFDLNPPLRYAGTDAKRRAWQDAFAAFTGPITYEVTELSVTTQGELAFAHGLNRVGGMLASGHRTDMWLRWTACFRRIDGAWLVIHDHVSVPAELARGRAAVDLVP